MTEEAKLIVAALRTSCEGSGSCPDCPVNYWCYAKNGDRLEDDAADIIESLSAQLEQVEKERDGLNIMLSQAQAMLETRTKELDAAVADMQKTPITLCEACARYHTGYPCSGGKFIDKINITIACTMFKWRGVQEVE